MEFASRLPYRQPQKHLQNIVLDVGRPELNANDSAVEDQATPKSVQHPTSEELEHGRNFDVNNDAFLAEDLRLEDYLPEATFERASNASSDRARAAPQHTFLKFKATPKRQDNGGDRLVSSRGSGSPYPWHASHEKTRNVLPLHSLHFQPVQVLKFSVEHDRQVAAETGRK